MVINKNRLIYSIILVVATAFWLIGMRLLLVEPESVHYHANFAIYVDGVRDPLERFSFYEEISACSPDNSNNPRSRVHLHDNNPYTVHVHDSAVTWGHLFANLGYALSDTSLTTDAGLLVPKKSKQLRFVLNGKPTFSVANTVINDEDVLLVDFSDSNEATVLQRYSEIPRDAHEFDIKQDPAACAGSQAETFMQRLERTIGW
ncbi:hypothetical protein KC878_04410 [Candidatus Saccharibacteria bacterium]|nr:hypothetical protein [Candidatus Saccharibacteria bacterium]MCB9821443.1 hypothetical protein [Candidatus Nomurabacteria bacterium]